MIDLKRRLAFALEIGALLFLVAMVVGVLSLARIGNLRPESLIGIVFHPGAGYLLLVTLICIWPALASPHRVVWPLPITLPLLYLTLIVLSLNLGPGAELRIIAPRMQLASSALWSSWKRCALLGCGQIATLSAVAWRAKKV